MNDTPDDRGFAGRADTAPAGQPSPPSDTNAAAGAERYKQTLQRRGGAGTGGGPSGPDTELWRGGYSAKAMIGSWLGAVLLTVAGLVGVVLLGFANPIAWLVWLGLAAVLWVGLGGVYLYRRWSKSYRLTSQRFVHETGLLTRVTDRIEVIDIDDVSFRQGIVQRMLGVGSIRISSSDRSHPELWLHGIDRVTEVAGLIDDTRRLERERRGVYVESV